MYVRWRKERQDWKGVIRVVLLQWGRLPRENSTHVGVSSNVRAPGKEEGKTRLKGSNPSYPASTHCGVESDVPF